MIALVSSISDEPEESQTGRLGSFGLFAHNSGVGQPASRWGLALLMRDGGYTIAFRFGDGVWYVQPRWRAQESSKEDGA
jgi:hypothetical protein